MIEAHELMKPFSSVDDGPSGTLTIQTDTLSLTKEQLQVWINSLKEQSSADDTKGPSSQYTEKIRLGGSLCVLDCSRKAGADL